MYVWLGLLAVGCWLATVFVVCTVMWWRGRGVLVVGEREYRRKVAR